MPLSDKINAKRDHLVTLRDELTELTENEVSSDDEIAEDTSLKIAELSRQIEASETDLENMLRAEKALAAKAIDRKKEAPPEEKDIGDQSQRLVRVTGGTSAASKKKGHRATAAAACMLKAHILRMSPFEVAKTDFKDQNEIDILIRAATDPATTTGTGWAAELVQETWSEFLELVRDIAVYPRLPGMRLEFDRYGKINIPSNEGRGKLSGGFVDEGAPIPVKEGLYGTNDLMPKKLAVITSFTKEIAEHSMPAIQTLVQTQMVEDTAEILDTYYLDAEARSATRPAGVQDPTETGAANINAATGATVAAVLADTKAMIERLLNARAGNGGVWLMNPVRILGLQDMQDAASGVFVFRDELAMGMFRGYPYITSQNVTADIVVLQGEQAMAYANDYGPRIEVSDETVLVYDDTAPGNISEGGGTPSLPVDQPIKSMFQIDGVAVKTKQGLDWRQVRANALQVLTGVAW